MIPGIEASVPGGTIEVAIAVAIYVAVYLSFVRVLKFPRNWVPLLVADVLPTVALTIRDARARVVVARWVRRNVPGVLGWFRCGLVLHHSGPRDRLRTHIALGRVSGTTRGLRGPRHARSGARFGCRHSQPQTSGDPRCRHGDRTRVDPTPPLDGSDRCIASIRSRAATSRY